MGDSVHTPLPGVGTLISDRYRLDELAGTGGMAQVWAATDTVLNRRVAVKILHQHLRSDPAFVERFRNEARSAARLHHHAVVTVYDTVSGDGADPTVGVEAIVMELVEGETLRTRLDRVGRSRPDEVVGIGVEVVGALDAAHQVNLIHRDIKPGNILLCAGGGVKVADFGIAKSDDDGDLTRDGTFVGTAGYLAPEQVEGGVVDGRADQFALGVVLYEMLTATMPFTGDTETTHAPWPDSIRSRSVLTRSSTASRCPWWMSSCGPGSRTRTPIRLDDGDGRRAGAQPRSHQPTGPRGPCPLGALHPRVRGDHRNQRPGHRWAPADTPEPPRPSLVRHVRAGPPDRWGIAAHRRARRLRRIPSPTRDAGDAASGDIVLVPITAVTPFDPEGSGAPGENDDQAGRAHDGNVSTEWRSERYEQRDFGVKSGVGLILQLDRTAEIQRVEIDSPTTNWSAEIHVRDGADPPTAPPDGPGDATLEGTPDGSTATVDLSGRGDQVLIWFTDLGDGPVRYRMDVGEVRVVGRI